MASQIASFYTLCSTALFRLTINENPKAPHYLHIGKKTTGDSRWVTQKASNAESGSIFLKKTDHVIRRLQCNKNYLIPCDNLRQGMYNKIHTNVGDQNGHKKCKTLSGILNRYALSRTNCQIIAQLKLRRNLKTITRSLNTLRAIPNDFAWSLTITYSRKTITR